MKKYLEIGPLLYIFQADEEIEIMDICGHYFYDSLQEIKNKEHLRIIYCDIQRVEEFENIQGDLVFQNSERMIFEYEGKEQRLHFDCNGVYGIYREIDKDHIRIDLDKKIVQKIEVGILFLEMLALERWLLQENALVLHSSFIKWKEKGIVFTAPSGTGKSTQADLWHKYKNANIINGDRSIIYKNEQTKKFEVNGLPFCGSSGINLDQNARLNAIIFLSQSKVNKAVPISKLSAVKRLFEEVSVNSWNPNFVEKSFNLIDEIADQIKTIYLECDISKEAVEVLEQLIEKR